MLTKVDFGGIVLWIVISSLAGVGRYLFTSPQDTVSYNNTLSYSKSLDLYLSTPRFFSGMRKSGQVLCHPGLSSDISILSLTATVTSGKQTLAPYSCFCRIPERHVKTAPPPPRIIGQLSLLQQDNSCGNVISHFLFIALSPLARAGPYITDNTSPGGPRGIQRAATPSAGLTGALGESRNSL